MSDEPDMRTEYLILVEPMVFAVGGIDRSSLVGILREARGILSNNDYVGLQGDLRTLLQGR